VELVFTSNIWSKQGQLSPRHFQPQQWGFDPCRFWKQSKTVALLQLFVFEGHNALQAGNLGVHDAVCDTKMRHDTHLCIIQRPSLDRCAVSKEAGRQTYANVNGCPKWGARDLSFFSYSSAHMPLKYPRLETASLQRQEIRFQVLGRLILK